MDLGPSNGRLLPRRGRKPGKNGNAAATYQAGIAAFEQGRYAEAIRLLSSIADHRSLSGTLGRFYLSQAHMHLGISELRLGRHASAARHLTAAREINPGSVDLSRYLLACHVGRGRFDLAVVELEKAQDQGRGDDATPIRLAHALARDGQHDRAIETLEDAIREEHQRADLFFQLGLLRAAAAELDEAVNALNDAARLAPFDASIQQHLGLALAARGDAAQAVRHLAIAQELRPHDAYVALLFTLAVEATQARGPGLSVDPTPVKTAPVDGAAVRALGDLIAEDPDFVEAFLSLPESDVDPEVFALLAAILEAALERHPDFADLHYHCSRVYARLGRTESAIMEADRAVEINPRYVRALIQLGRLHAQTDRSAEAIDRLRAAIDSGGDYPDVHLMLGELYSAGGEPEQARTEYRRALELNADYSRAQSALKELATS
ncbi:MAG: tetratricopeptide repeat protein [Phycisphaerae bacterium]|nr:tetratricopeptide repeat protein [Phycisphaerae bacterium]